MRGIVFWGCLLASSALLSGCCCGSCGDMEGGDEAAEAVSGDNEGSEGGSDEGGGEAPAGEDEGASGGGRHGAIARSPSSTFYGLAYNQPSGEAAEAAAVARCGQSDCEVGEVFPEGHCVVVSVFKKGKINGVAWGNETTKEGAREALKGICAENGLNCPIASTACSDGAGPGALRGGSSIAADPDQPVAVSNKKASKPQQQGKKECSDSSQCPRGFECIIRRCPGCSTCERKLKEAGQPCRKTSECQAGLICDDGGVGDLGGGFICSTP